MLDQLRRVRYIIHRVEDVTEFVRLRERGDEQAAVTAELREQAEGMEAEIVRRSQELQAANAELRKAGAAKNEFLSRMSHELRTPLAAILGFSELLATRDLGEKPDEWARMIHVAGEHLLTLVDEIMDLSRIEAGTVGISTEAVSLRPLVEEAFQLMRPVAAGHDITLFEPVFTETTAAGYVLADRQRLTQVVINLMSNAIKYNRHRGTVVVEAEHDDGRDPPVGGRHRPGHRARTSCPASSRRSSGSTPPRRGSTAPGSASRSPGGWSRRWAAGSASRAARASADVLGRAAECPAGGGRDGGSRG